jgi:hypothetical protein
MTVPLCHRAEGELSLNSSKGYQTGTPWRWERQRRLETNATGPDDLLAQDATAAPPSRRSYLIVREALKGQRSRAEELSMTHRSGLRDTIHASRRVQRIIGSSVTAAFMELEIRQLCSAFSMSSFAFAASPPSFKVIDGLMVIAVN